MNSEHFFDNHEIVDKLFEIANESNFIDPEHYSRYNVKRGLRNSNGTGVLVGLTNIGDVHGYIFDENEKVDVEGRLRYRGVNVTDMVRSCIEEDRFGFEEVVYLLLFGTLPTKEQLDNFCAILARCRELPEDFIEDMIMKAPSSNIMNKMARAVMTLMEYSRKDFLTSFSILISTIF